VRAHHPFGACGEHGDDPEDQGGYPPRAERLSQERRGQAQLPMIGKLPDGLCPAEGLPAANCATVLVRGRAGIDPDLLSAADAAVRDVLAGEN
jgi:hypothetical protein